MVDAVLAQVRRDRDHSAYWMDRPSDLDAVESWLNSLRAWVPASEPIQPGPCEARVPDQAMPAELDGFAAYCDLRSGHSGRHEADLRGCNGGVVTWLEPDAERRR